MLTLLELFFFGTDMLTLLELYFDASMLNVFEKIFDASMLNFFNQLFNTMPTYFKLSSMSSSCKADNHYHGYLLIQFGAS